LKISIDCFSEVSRMSPRMIPSASGTTEKPKRRMM
jgi:hypothetical protein